MTGPAHERFSALERSLEKTPQDAALHRALAQEKRARGDELGALAHLIAAKTLDTHAAGTLADSATGLCNVATGYFMKGELETAERWYRLVLEINPDLASAWQNLASIHASAQRNPEAETCRARAYAIQRVFIESAGTPARRVLILCSARTAGNVPVETLLPAATCCRIKYAIDYAAPEEDAQLPPYDLVFNAIGEADVAAPLHDRLEHFARHCRHSLLNPPSAVARTARHRLPELLGGLDGVVLAHCIRCERPPGTLAALADLLAGGGIRFPLLSRPAASHGGAGLLRCDTIDELANALNGASGARYLTNFYDTRGADGYYRKYRVIFIDGVPFAYHLAISPEWMVHYFSADMQASNWKIEAERHFLENPGAVLGARAMDLIVAIGRRLGLHYGGIDFALLPDGRVFVFEANATMLIHHERQDGVLGYKNLHVQRIVDAFEGLLSRTLKSS